MQPRINPNNLDIIDPCQERDNETSLLKELIKTRRSQTYLRAGEYAVKGKRYWLKQGLLRRERHVDGMPQPQIKYDVLSEEPIGRGAFSRVYGIEKTITAGQYLGKDTWRIKDDGNHVVKLTYESDDEGEETTLFDEFKAERDKLVQTQRFHPKEIQKYNVEFSIPTNFLTTRKFKGQSLDWIINKGNVMTVEQRFRLTIALLRALKEQVHDIELIHRDIKPGNIIVDLNSMEVNIIDYGLSIEKNNQDGKPCGTPHYTSPEILQSPYKVDEKSDIFSMGRLLSNLWGDTGEIWRLPPLTALDKLGKGHDFDLQGLFTKNKNNDPFKDLTETDKNHVTALLTNMLKREPNKRHPLDQLIIESHHDYLVHCKTKNEDISTLSNAFQEGLKARDTLRQSKNVRSFLTNLNTKLACISDNKDEIKEFTHGIGWHCLETATSKNEVREEAKKIFTSLCTIGDKYIKLIEKAQDILANSYVNFNPALYGELHEFIWELNHKMNRLKQIPYDLDVIEKTAESLEGRYDLWSARFNTIQTNIQTNLTNHPYCKYIADVIGPASTVQKSPELNIKLTLEQIDLRSSLEDLKNALREAIHMYIAETLTDSNILKHERAASDNRKKDIKEFVKIINESKNINELTDATKKRMDDIKTGRWWFFSSSKLKSNLNKALDKHEKNINHIKTI